MFFFKRKRQEPKTADAIPGKLVVTSDIHLQSRRAQNVSSLLAEAIRRVCRENDFIMACYLLDLRKPQTGEIGFAIAITVEDEVHQMDSVAQHFQTMLRDFPDMAPKTVIMSSATFLPNHAGAEFYSRSAA